MSTETMNDTVPRKNGRPSIFTDELVQTVFDRIAAGELLIKICEENDMPSTATFFRWIEQKEGLREAYTRARRDQADWFAEDTLRIADEEPDANKARVRVLARQWLAAKLNAGKYSDKLALTGHDGGPLAIQVMRFELPAPELKDVTPGARVLEHVAAHAPQAPDHGQVVDKTEDDKS